MQSSRPLLPSSSSGAQIWRHWLLHSVAGRTLLAALAIKAVANIIGFIAPSTWAVLDAVDAVGSLALLLVAAYAVTRGLIWAKRRLLWRVRRKLILSYVFVGLVPGLLIIAFFTLALLLLFFNVSTYLLQTRVRMLVDEARFIAQAAVLEAEHGDAPDVLRRRMEQRQGIAEGRFPFTSVAIVPVADLACKTAGTAVTPSPQPMTIGPWRHIAPPAQLPRWIGCQGFAGLTAYLGEAPSGRQETRLVMRAVAVPQTVSPTWAVVVDLPFTVAIEQRLRDETGIRLGEATALPFEEDRTLAHPRGVLLEQRPADPDDTATAFGEGWVAFLDVIHWGTGRSSYATVAIRLNFGEIYDRMTGLSSGRELGRILLVVLAVIGVLFLTIQLAALVIGFVLARQITGAVHDLFTGTEHLRNRNFTHQIPVRARDQLGELADSFNVMTGEVTTLLRENAEKARMEQEMLAAREIQQKLLPSGEQSIPGLTITAFCEPAREVAGDYYDFLHISPTKLGVLIADVSGKGLPAGLYMAQLKILVQSMARMYLSPREFLIAINRVIADNIDSKSFITMSYGVIDLEKQEMVFARAGHCPLILVPGAAPAGLRKSQLLTPDGLVLGLKIDDGQMFDGMIEEQVVPLNRDDLIVFFTDGISETMDAAFDCYGEVRLAKLLEQYSHLPFDQLRSFIFADLRAFAGDADQHDDMTMILLRVEAPVAA
ncbi:MAG TPA: SpoIIE family protein phosphatase [Vicinamibacterales bacterium]|nr:SpoIIE family protein phosphatase [Vicinamibacterales bacterium]